MVKGENMKVIEKRKNGSIRVYTVNNEPTMTDQQFKAIVTGKLRDWKPVSQSR